MFIGFGSYYTECMACLNNDNKSNVDSCFLAEFIFRFYKNENDPLLLFLAII